MKVTSSIVLYKNDKSTIQSIIDGILSSNICTKIFLIDNSPTNELISAIQSDQVIYIHNPSNPGFGAAHNIAIQKAINEGSEYHFIINPDIEIKEEVIWPMINYISTHPEVGMMMPKILNKDGSIQNLPKLLPSPFWILRRKLNKIDPFNKAFINKYELRSIPQNQLYNAPILSGCFTLLRLEAIQNIGMYDENFFMYFEDFDLSRRMHEKYKTIYFPKISVIHGYEGGANKNWRLFKIFIKSMITYFNKWGWFFDFDRTKINRETLKQFD